MWYSEASTRGPWLPAFRLDFLWLTGWVFVTCLLGHVSQEGQVRGWKNLVVKQGLSKGGSVFDGCPLKCETSTVHFESRPFNVTTSLCLPCCQQGRIGQHGKLLLEIPTATDQLEMSTSEILFHCTPSRTSRVAICTQVQLGEHHQPHLPRVRRAVSLPPAARRASFLRRVVLAGAVQGFGRRTSIKVFLVVPC